MLEAISQQPGLFVHPEAEPAQQTRRRLRWRRRGRDERQLAVGLLLEGKEHVVAIDGQELPEALIEVVLDDRDH